jgi:hypothetical protein
VRSLPYSEAAFVSTAGRADSRDCGDDSRDWSG